MSRVGFKPTTDSMGRVLTPGGNLSSYLMTELPIWADTLGAIAFTIYSKTGD